MKNHGHLLCPGIEKSILKPFGDITLVSIQRKTHFWFLRHHYLYLKITYSSLFVEDNSKFSEFSKIIVQTLRFLPPGLYLCTPAAWHGPSYQEEQSEGVGGSGQGFEEDRRWEMFCCRSSAPQLQRRQCTVHAAGRLRSGLRKRTWKNWNYNCWATVVTHITLVSVGIKYLVTMYFLAWTWAGIIMLLR